jgi:catechol 2,3-dioxygenase-like lactoylglutathione lyase family enzyme
MIRETPMPHPTAITGLTGVEHIGLTVPDIDAAARFFTDVLGAEAIYDIGPFEHADDWMANHLAPTKGAHIYRMRVIKIANGPVLELMQFTGPECPAPGGWHMAFYVEDMETALTALKAHAVKIQSGPVTMTEGPSKGLEWLYFQAPWGQQLELVSYPGGIAAYKEKRLEIWRPQ